MTTFLADASEWTHDDLVAVVRDQLADQPYGMADALRTAAMYVPRASTSNEFVAAAVECGINPSTARCRFNETRKWMVEIGQ